MNIIELYKKSNSNPWDKEPFKREFEYKDFPCIILKHPTQHHLCGYIGIYSTNGLSNMPIDDINEFINIHGGFTHYDSGNNINLPITVNNKLIFWLGFDCAHYNDYVPGLEEFQQFYSYQMSIMNKENVTYKDGQFVENELKKAIDQIIRIYGPQ